MVKVAKIFVGHLAADVIASNLAYLFARYGEVVDVKIFTHNCALVLMAHYNAASQAVNHLQGRVVNGSSIYLKLQGEIHWLVKGRKRIQIVPRTVDEERACWAFFVTNIGHDIAIDEVLELFRPYGTVVDARMYRPTVCRVLLQSEHTSNVVISNISGKFVKGYRIRVDHWRGKIWLPKDERRHTTDEVNMKIYLCVSIKCRFVYVTVVVVDVLSSNSTVLLVLAAECGATMRQLIFQLLKSLLALKNVSFC